MRAFIAIELSPEIKEALARLVKDLQEEGIQGRWVPPSNIHLTLRFLGNIQDEQVGDIERLMEEAAKGFHPFTVSLEGLGAFPHAARPRVLWVGVVEGKDPLSRLQERLERGLASMGFPPEEKAFKPHLTLARFKFPKEEVGRRVYQACRKREKAGWGVMEAASVVLFKSILSPQGARYRKVKEASFSP
jgi:2'-5' RNA ligase